MRAWQLVIIEWNCRESLSTSVLVSGLCMVRLYQNTSVSYFFRIYANFHIIGQPFCWVCFGSTNFRYLLVIFCNWTCFQYMPHFLIRIIAAFKVLYLVTLVVLQKLFFWKRIFLDCICFDCSDGFPCCIIHLCATPYVRIEKTKIGKLY